MLAPENVLSLNVQTSRKTIDECFGTNFATRYAFNSAPQSFDAFRNETLEVHALKTGNYPRAISYFDRSIDKDPQIVHKNLDSLQPVKGNSIAA